MDGPFWVDTRTPHISVDATAVTLSTTFKAMFVPANVPVLGSNYFAFIGKAVRMTMYGRMTTGTTPGNGNFGMYLGSGADANGTLIGSAAAFALGASQTNKPWRIEYIVRCRALGTSGQLIIAGHFSCDVALVAGTAQPALIPQAAITVDLTVANVLMPHFLRSGSTAETIQVQEFVFEALN